MQWIKKGSNNITETPIDTFGTALPSIKLPSFVGVLYSEVKREYFPSEEQYITEVGVIDEARTVANYLEKMGVRSKIYPGNGDLSNYLRRDKPDMVFNLVQSVRGHEEVSPTISALLELLEVPYTGTGVLGLSITYNKYFTKKLLEQVGLPTPRYQLFNSPNDPIDQSLKFPLIPKLNEIHGSVGIDETSVTENEKQLRAKIKDLMIVYKQPVLVEEFIVGREITSIILEGNNKKVYTAEKILPDIPNSKYKLASFSYQWADETPAEYVKHENGGYLKDYIRTAFDVLKMDDYAKFDLRLDESGRYYFIDCNANPAFGPKEIGIAIGTVLELYGVSFEEVLRRIIENTQKDNSFKVEGNGN